MQIEQRLLIDELLDITDKAVGSIKKFKLSSHADLNFKRNTNEWSILECLEHLNLYGDFYLPEIEKRLMKNVIKSKNSLFKSGIIGNYFAKLMKVENGKITKMKSPKDKNPLHSKLSVATIERLLEQLEKLKILLQKSRTIDLAKVKTAISLTKLIKLRLGDTLRFFVYHIERHILQAENTATK